MIFYWQAVVNILGSTTLHYIDILSNGFKIRGAGTELNETGAPYIYMAFGQPIISNSGIMPTAR